MGCAIDTQIPVTEIVGQDENHIRWLFSKQPCTAHKIDERAYKVDDFHDSMRCTVPGLESRISANRAKESGAGLPSFRQLLLPDVNMITAMPVGGDGFGAFVCGASAEATLLDDQEIVTIHCSHFHLQCLVVVDTD